MRLICVLLAALAASLVAPAGAAADAFLPPAGKIWHGITAGADVRDHEARVGRRAAVWQHFIAWGGSYEYAFDRSESAGARVMLHVSTARGQNLPESLSPGDIARGRGDRFLLGLNARLAAHGRPSYLRLFGEMNNCDNAYAAFDCDGSRRDGDHSAATFKRAWKRAVLILRGGGVAAIDARLRGLGLPPAATGETVLPRPPVAFVWSPMTGGSPMIAALAPGRYWPGPAWVDWVGTSFYSRFPNFRWLTPFYDRFATRERKPFMLAEWAIWGGDSPGFVGQLFDWVKARPRVRMLQYNQGNDPSGPFRLRHFPRSERAIRGALASPRFVDRVPEQR